MQVRHSLADFSWRTLSDQLSIEANNPEVPYERFQIFLSPLRPAHSL